MPDQNDLRPIIITEEEIREVLGPPREDNTLAQTIAEQQRLADVEQRMRALTTERDRGTQDAREAREDSATRAARLLARADEVVRPLLDAAVSESVTETVRSLLNLPPNHPRSRSTSEAEVDATPDGEPTTEVRVVFGASPDDPESVEVSSLSEDSPPEPGGSDAARVAPPEDLRGVPCATCRHLREDHVYVTSDPSQVTAWVCRGCRDFCSACMDRVSVHTGPSTDPCRSCQRDGVTREEGRCQGTATSNCREFVPNQEFVNRRQAERRVRPSVPARVRPSQNSSSSLGRSPYGEPVRIPVRARFDEDGWPADMGRSMSGTDRYPVTTDLDRADRALRRVNEEVEIRKARNQRRAAVRNRTRRPFRRLRRDGPTEG